MHRRKELKELPEFQNEQFIELDDDYIAYKAVVTSVHTVEIITLLLQKGTILYTGDCKERVGVSNYGKMRVDQAVVITQKAECCHSYDYPEFLYKRYEQIVPTQPFSFSKEQCQSGIHIFRTKERTTQWKNYFMS